MLKKYEIISTFVIMILGTLLHFTYELSNENVLISLFSSVNESVWEHLKLLYFPSLLMSLIGYFYFRKNHSNYLCAKTKGILLSFTFIITFFYTYTGILGKSIAFLDISSFFIAVIIGQVYSFKKIDNPCNQKLTVITIILLTIAFILFTFYPPTLGIFNKPVPCFWHK